MIKTELNKFFNFLISQKNFDRLKDVFTRNQKQEKVVLFAYFVYKD